MALGRAPDGRPLAWKQRIAEWEAGRDPSPAGGESMERVGERVGELVRALARSRRGTSVVLVAHSEVIGAYLGHVRGTPAPKRYPPGLANGSITRRGRRGDRRRGDPSSRTTSPRRPDGPPQSAETTSSTFSAWPSTLTLGKTLRTTPSPSMTKVERIMPIVFLP